jgi:transcriptional regulator with GAF, ATPase, and Fis domain
VDDDRTRTETALDADSVDTGRPVPGLVCIFSGDRSRLGAHPITAITRIGRDQSAQIVLDDHKASREHAEIALAPGGVTIEDLGSHNGTYVNGARLGNERVFAPLRSTLRIGRTLFRVVPDVRPYTTPPPADDILIGGPSLAAIRRTISMIGTATTPVLIEGETGTGKEVVALAIHRASGRTGALIAVNCAALPEELVESELFGHARGAFSGSQRARDGLFRSAERGVLLLDEIGDLPLAAQAKLLRVLETGEVRAVGDDHGTRVDVRVVAATNRALDQMVLDCTFRADLLHRVASSRVKLPPLRSRREDIPTLCDHFLALAGAASDLSFSAAAMERLVLHDFPGNVRELRNLVGSAIASVRARNATSIGRDDLPGLAAISDVSDPADTAEPSDLQRTRRAGADTDEARQSVDLIDALRVHQGNVSHVAKALGLRRARVYELLHRFDIDPEKFR